MSDDDLRRAEALLEVGRWQQAQPLLASAIATEPTSARAACLMAKSHQLARDWHSMLAEAQRACGLDPGNEWAHRQRSFALRELGRPWEAVEAAREAQRLSPDSWQGRLQLVDALLACKNIDAAMNAWYVARDALAIAPDDPAVRATAGRVAMALGDDDAARTHFHAVLADHPDDAMARTCLAILDVRRGRGGAAARQFAAAAAADPTDPLHVHNSRIAAVVWLGNLTILTATLYLLARISRVIPQPASHRAPLAALVAIGSTAAIFYAYRRLPPGTRRMVRWPVHVPVRYRFSEGRLRTLHLLYSTLAVLQVFGAVAALATRSPAWVNVHGVILSTVIFVLPVQILVWFLRRESG
jgi:tetratricopeptide (TPR) repeat protein